MRDVKTWIAIAAVACIAGCANGGTALTSPSPVAAAASSAPSSCIVPGVPNNLAAQVTDDTVSLSWSTVSEASDYVVLVGWTPASSETVLTNTADAQHTVDDLPAGTHYARVYAHNWCGTSESSRPISFRVD